MNSVIRMLEIKRELLIQELKVAQGEAHSRILEGKRELDTAILWLKKIEILQLHNPNDYIFTKLPETKTTFSEYKIVETLESDDPKDWQEVKLTNEDEELWLYEGDWVLKSKK
ncbi:hypothetical protein PAECIP112173_04656 [Paenibacillus sp. JJ-100]|uniref:hypothetical protein n=1 Tax=Paenibacillus sp. JJ-100 TaxID=2974896 RepID=UPI0022FF9201|nr:hypothetical protein [Paenibacillus sp. JJ-100]CAI6085484.1 hypothetical protein PAECIP112173_04656 [Paenibacillus sp. JJ-100]